MSVSTANVAGFVRALAETCDAKGAEGPVPPSLANDYAVASREYSRRRPQAKSFDADNCV